MRGLIMDLPLLVSEMIDYAADCHPQVEVVARELDGRVTRQGYGEAQRRAKRLAQALLRLGVRQGERIGALAWNTARYFEMFYGVSGLGAVLHTINPRLFDEQIVYIVNHAEDAWLFVDAGTLTLAERLAPQFAGLRGYVFMGARKEMPASSLQPLLCYEELLAAEDGQFDWPSFDERTACTICYTSGTTGNPKGVVYTHRSATLSALFVGQYDMLGDHRSGEAEVYMPIAPLFHGNGWMMPYLAPMHGAKLVLPGRNYEPDKLLELIEGEDVTVAAGVPTVWLTLVNHLKATNRRFGKLKAVLMSGAKPPESLIRALQEDFGVDAMQTWGMTESLTAGKCGLPPGLAGRPFAERLPHKLLQGRRAFGTRFRIVDDAGEDLPKDGRATGHLQVRGPIVAAGYLKQDGVVGGTGVADGWLHTGDVARLYPDGGIELADRSKDVIKSGGEWISSVELENLAMGHPAVLEAAAIAVAHPKWQERPLLIVVRRPGAQADAAGILDYLKPRLASWWLPDAVEFLDELPHTATGKVHKLSLRERFKDYRLPNA